MRVHRYMNLHYRDIHERPGRTRKQELAARRNWNLLLARGAIANLINVDRNTGGGNQDELERLGKRVERWINMSWQTSRRQLEFQDNSVQGREKMGGSV